MWIPQEVSVSKDVKCIYLLFKSNPWFKYQIITLSCKKHKLIIYFVIV